MQTYMRDNVVQARLYKPFKAGKNTFFNFNLRIKQSFHESTGNLCNLVWPTVKLSVRQSRVAEQKTWQWSIPDASNIISWSSCCNGHVGMSRVGTWSSFLTSLQVSPLCRIQKLFANFTIWSNLSFQNYEGTASLCNTGSAHSLYVSALTLSVVSHLAR